MRTFLVLCIVATIGVLGSPGDADAAGIPPTILFTLSCGAGVGVIEWEATNNDLGAHALEQVLQPGGGVTPAPLAAGAGTTGGGAAIADATAAGIDIYEDGVLLASSGLFVVDLDDPDCWVVPLDMAPVDQPVAPDVDIETQCTSPIEVEVSATNVDGEAHDVHVALLTAGGAPDEVVLELDAGEAVEQHEYVVAPGGLHRVVATENGTELADSGWFLIDPDAPDCADEIPAADPTITFETHCDDGGTAVDVHIVNNDLQAHDLDVLLEMIGVGTLDLLFPGLADGEASAEVETFVPFGTTFVVTVEEGGLVLATSPEWQSLADDGFCVTEPDPDLPFVPLGEIPDDQPTTTTVPQPEPDPTTTTTSTTPTTVPTATSAPEQTSTTEAFTAGELVRSFEIPVPAGSTDVPAVEPARAALPRTGAPINGAVPLGWLLIGAGYLVKRAAARR